MRTLLLVLTICAALPCFAHAAVPPNIATFSVAAYDPRTGEVGVAVQSKFFAVGNVVPWCKSGVGAVATQAFGQPEYGRMALDLMREGNNPTIALLGVLGRTEGLPGSNPLRDEKAQQRQLGLVSVNGADIAGASSSVSSEHDGSLVDTVDGEHIPYGSTRWTATTTGQATTFTGAECLNWAGGRTGITPDGVIYAVQGNILTGPEVVDAMATAMDNPTGIVLSGAYANGQVGIALNTRDFAGRLLGALVAGQLAGGDSRGMQSAALQVRQAGSGYGGYNDLKYDLRVDDATDPFIELARLLNLARPIQLTFAAYNALESGNSDEAIRIFSDLANMEPENASHHYNLACGLARAGRSDEAIAYLTTALTLDPKLKELAKSDTDLTSLRERDDFKKLTE